MSMKYDAGMTQYHGNIATAIKRMCRHDKTAMKLVKDASPAPLREHLKKSYKYNGAGDASSFYQGSPKDMKIEFSGESIILSWSQVAKFIRDNPSEIFDDYNALPDQPVCECNTENNKTYLEVFREHYPNVNVGILYEEYCPEEFFENGTGANDGECQENCCFCWSTPAKSEWSESEGHYVPEEWKAAETDTEEFSDEELEQDRAALKDAIADVSEKHIDCPYYKKGAALNYIGYGAVHFECQKHEEKFSDPHKLKVFINNHCYNSVWCNYCQEQKPQDKPAELPTVQPERAAEVAEKFNYAVLTAELGDYLRHKEEQLRNEYMNFTANCGRIFAEAQERLAKHGFGENNGVFDKWISSMGFAKPTVYRMISVYNFRSSQIETNEQAQLFDSLSKSLQYEVAKPSAPPELVEQVMNGDITTHKEYIELKKQLEEAKENLEISKDDAQKAEERAEYAENANSKLSVKNSELERRVKELESKPVDVAVPDEEEIERLSLEKSKGLLRAKDMECDRRLREMQDESRDKDKEISELKERLITIGENSEQIENFFEDMYNDAYRALKRCFEFVSESGFTPQTVNKLRLRLNSFSGVVNDFIEEMQQ